ncbi:MAG: cysteine desulfurase [Planctomycetes bacterium]|nr:cysteine desulfurase [Planctomycetota bacterium]MBI3834771.1 cysteine desulfurase [Planctomycetota bacterium]
MIYLDYNASTPVADEVREAMLPFLNRRHYGNPSSTHVMGKPLREAIETAREQVAQFIGASPKEIIFTSGGTEANNHVIKGVTHAHRDRGAHIITSKVEHPAVIQPYKHLESLGYEVSYVGVDSHGMIDPHEVAGEVRGHTVLISIMHANNEVGTIQPIAEIAELAREGGIILHTDAAQSCGKIPTNVNELGVDCLSIAGHKLYAPQGIGALYVRRETKIESFLHGAGHQSGRRAGTEPVALIVGLGAACALAMHENHESRLRELRDRLESQICTALGDEAVRLGHPEHRLPNTSAIGFRGKLGAVVLAKCPDICASTGAACHSGKHDVSATLSAMGVPIDVALGAVRLSVGRYTTEEEVDEAARQITHAAKN